MILEEYMRIAFADMTDYVEFDNRRVRLKNSADVDGRLITEVKQGKDGVTIKLADKMKAIERLEKLFNVIPDRKLQLELEKFEFTKQLAQKQVDTGNKVIILNDL
jgi:phage terminase small subunit